MSSLSSHTARRSIILLSCTVVLPVLALAAFSLFAMRSQRQSMERERERRADVLAEGILDQISRTFQQMESGAEDVSRVLLNQDVAGPLLVQARRQTPVEAVWIAASDGTLRAPLAPWQQPALPPTPLAPNFKQDFGLAEYLEIQGATEEALDSYECLLPALREPGEQALLLNAMARCCQKTGQFDEALELYRQIIRICPSARAPNGIALSAVACFEAAALEFQQGQFSNSLRSATVFLRDLQAGRIPSSRDESRYYLNGLDELVAKIPAFAGDQPLRTDYMIAQTLLSNLLMADGIMDIMRQQPQRYKAVNQRFVYQSLDVQTLVGMKQAEAVNNRIVFSVRADDLKKQWAAAIRQALQYADGFAYEVRDASQQVFYASAGNRLVGPVIRRGLAPDRLPGWELAVSVQESPALQAGARLRVLTTGGLIVILLLVIATSLYFMNAMIRREAELSAMKTDFVSAVSHEMRTPLTTIRMIAEMFQLDRVKDPQMSRDYIETIAGETKRLTRLINKVLDFSRLDSGRKPYTLTLQDPGPIVASTVQMFEAGVKADGYQINLDLQPALPPVAVDSDALTEVVLNLLDNAVKYSPLHKEIRVAVRRQVQDLAIEVADQGIGIDPHKKDKIFEKFYRGEDELTRQTKGTGIGLAIVKHIVEAHRGRIEVRSTRGAGSVFTVFLPV